MNSSDLLEKTCSELNISPYMLGKRLGYGGSRIYDIKTGRTPFPVKDISTVCEWANVDPATVLAQIQADRATRPDEKQTWQRIADIVEKAAGVSAALLLAFSVFLTNTEIYEPAFLTVASCILCQIPQPVDISQTIKTFLYSGGFFGYFVLYSILLSFIMAARQFMAININNRIVKNV